MTRDLSVKGVTRRHAPPLVAVQVALNGGVISVRDHILGGAGSLRARLEDWAGMDVSFSVSECIYGWNVAFRQTWTHVVVRVRLNFDPGISAATITTLRNTWENTIQTRWSDAWGAARAGELRCPLTFDVQWVTSDPDYTVRVRAAAGQTDLANWDAFDSGAVASHEFGHMLGNPDEYTDPACPSRTPVNTGTIMDNNSNTIPSRLVARFATNLGSNVVA